MNASIDGTVERDEGEKRVVGGYHGPDVEEQGAGCGEEEEGVERSEIEI